MKVYAISDLHLSINNPKPMDIFGPVWENYLDKIISDWKNKVKDEDIVLLAGDFSWAMKLEETIQDFRLLENLPGKKIIIRGNHDYWWKSISAVRNILPKNFYAIQNDAIKFDNVIICGTRGWIVPEKNGVISEENKKIYDREVIRLELSLQSALKLKEDGDILICMLHYPPTNYSKEDNQLTKLIEQYNVNYVVFGHIHGLKNVDKMFIKNNIPYYLSSCDMVNNSLVLIKDEK